MIGPEFINEIVRFFFKEAFPFKQQINYSSDELRELKRKYGKWKFITIVLMLIYMTLALMLYVFVLSELYKFFYSVILSKGAVFYPATEMIFFVPGLLLMLASLDIIFLTPTQKFFLRDKYQEFEDYMNYMKGVKKGFDNKRIGIVLPKIFAMAGIIAIIFCFSTKVILTGKSLIIKKTLAITETVYQFNEVKRIVLFENYFDNNGHIIYNPHSMIYFKNGDQFSTSLFRTAVDKIKPLEQILSQKCNVKIENVKFDFNKN